jgi:hydroxymethylbilane synthase
MPLTDIATLRIGTRTSKLARWQTDYVAGLLQAAWPGLACEVVPFSTEGDRVLDRALPEFGGKGVFTQELEHALHEGQIDLAVHSLKDLPIDPAAGLSLGAICPRADARDVLISRAGFTLRTLPAGARVGTSSVRRAAQLLAARPDLVLLPLRGNVDTRVSKALRGEYDAIVLAAAGVTRLGLEHDISEFLPFDLMLPAPGQGAVAVQCRAADEPTRARLQAIHHPATAAAVTAERAFLSGLGGGCSAPVAAYAEYALREGAGWVTLHGCVASPDGRQVIRVLGAGADPQACGAMLVQTAIAQGAAALVAGEALA